MGGEHAMWFLFLWLLPSLAVGLLGRDRAIGFLGFFLLSLLVSPVLSLIVLLITTPRRRRAR
jgi:hypothetical protein